MPSLTAIGIDPGWKSFGVCVLDIDIAADTSTVKLLKNLVPAKKGLESFIDEFLKGTRTLGIAAGSIERYVAYQGVHNSDSEFILEVIGATRYGLYSIGAPCHTTRAIDWKPALAKYLYKSKGFRNPSDSFDKVFSVAAARCILGPDYQTKISTHEADAVCLAYITRFQQK